MSWPLTFAWATPIVVAWFWAAWPSAPGPAWYWRAAIAVAVQAGTLVLVAAIYGGETP